MGANDSHEWLKREIDWLEVPLAEEKPFLGICLGAQMLARALGARVFTFEDKRSEIGYFPISPTRRRGPALRGTRFRAAPTSGTPTGSTCPTAPNSSPPAAKDFPNQAYRYGKGAVGLQFHPEVTYHMMCRWTIRGAERLTRPGAQSRPAHLGGWYQHDGRVAAWLEAFLPDWIDGRLGKSAAPLRPAVKRPKPVETPRHLAGDAAPGAGGQRPSLAELASVSPFNTRVTPANPGASLHKASKQVSVSAPVCAAGVRPGMPDFRRPDTERFQKSEPCPSEPLSAFARLPRQERGRRLSGGPTRPPATAATFPSANSIWRRWA